MALGQHFCTAFENPNLLYVTSVQQEILTSASAGVPLQILENLDGKEKI